MAVLASLDIDDKKESKSKEFHHRKLMKANQRIGKDG
jgi:hypothetical protein